VYSFFIQVTFKVESADVLSTDYQDFIKLLSGFESDYKSIFFAPIFVIFFVVIINKFPLKFL